jgi:hypothetical protein
MWSVFEANLSFDHDGLMNGVSIQEVDRVETEGYDGWLLERKVKVPGGLDTEGELGDSGCFGVRTVEIGSDCIWKLHGGV